MAACPHCSFSNPAELDDTSVFCAKCGRLLNEESQSADAAGTFLADELAEHERLVGEETLDFSIDVPAGVEETFALDTDDVPQTIDLDGAAAAAAERTNELEDAPENIADEDTSATIALSPEQARRLAALDAEADATFVMPDDVDDASVIGATIGLDGSARPDDADKTFVSENFSADAFPADEAGETIASAIDIDDALRTIASNFDLTGGEQDPRMTIKSRGAGTARDSVLGANPHDTVPYRAMGAKGQPLPSRAPPEYELMSMLGEGGMGIVWLAHQTSVDRTVAIKMIRGAFADKPAQRQKFLAEAIVTGDLDHPNIVPIYDVGRDLQGSLFYSMKQVKGTAWHKAISQKSQAENIEILMRVADAMAFAHARGIVHRDLKPENIMLGEFGEVLVMDWGLALILGNPEKAKKLRQTSAMGGTPAYMAPEMVSGPIGRITWTSDIFLLGAILWEIVTGRPPHPGKKLEECLLDAMRNTIAPTEKTGELIDIARRAMATNAADRYQSVREFQGAIRGYLSHAESISMGVRAHDDLARGRRSGSYEDFSKAAFGFEEAVALWDGNLVAVQGRRTAKLAYAENAFQKGDYDLATSLLDPTDAEHAALASQVAAAIQERGARKRRLELARRAMVTLIALILVIVTGAFLWIRGERNEALSQKGIAEEQRAAAVEARDSLSVSLAETEKARADEERQRQRAEASALEAEQQRRAAQEQERLARMSADEAILQRSLAEKSADEARKQQQIAERASEAEKYEAYIARIGLASSKIQENSFNVASQLLKSSAPELRNWEWGRLSHLCEQSAMNVPIQAPVDAVAISPDGQRFLMASWDHTVRIVDLKTRTVVRELRQEGLYVHAVAWHGNTIATGGSDPTGYIRLWDAQSGTEIARFNGHSDAVVGLTFDPSGRWLISTSYDNTARLWDVQDIAQPQMVAVLSGHSWWVWDGAFSPQFDPANTEIESRIVTASQDGKAIVWKIRPASSTTLATSTTAIVTELLAEEEATFTGHAGPVYCVDINTDGLVATGGYDRKIFLWRPEQVPAVSLDDLLYQRRSPMELQTLNGHLGPVQSVAFSKSGDVLASGGRDNNVMVWDVELARAIKTFRGHSSEVTSVEFTPDGTRIVSGGKDQQAIIWGLSSYDEIRELKGRILHGHVDAVLCARFSADGQQVVTAGRDRVAVTWDVRSGEPLREFQEGHEYLATAARLTADGQTLLTAAADSTVRAWSVANGTQLCRLKDTGHAAVLDISDDGQWLVTGDHSHSVRLYRVAKLIDPGRVDADAPLEPEQLIDGHHGVITAVAFLPGSENRFLTCDVNGRCILHRVGSPTPLWDVQHHTSRVTGCVVASNGQSIYTSSHDHTVSIVNSITGEELATLSVGTPISSIAINYDGSAILTVSALPGTELLHASRVTLWDTESQRKLREIDTTEFAVSHIGFAPQPNLAVITASDNTVRFLKIGPKEEGIGPPLLDFQELRGIVWSAEFTRNRKSLITVGGNETRLWDTTTFREQMRFSPHGAVAAAAFSPDGSQLVTGSWDNTAKLWDAATGQPLLRFSGGHSSFINSVQFSSDGTQVLTASDDATAILWTARSGEIVRRFVDGHSDRIRSAVFSPAGDRVLTTSNDKTAILWNTETGQPIRTLRGHEWPVLCGQFSRDGRRIVTGSEDNTAKLWDAETGDPLGDFVGHTAAITGVDFSLDGHRLFTSSRDGTAKLWEANPAQLAKLRDMNGKYIAKEILTLSEHSQELTTIQVSPDGQMVLTAGRDGKAILWLTSPWTAKPAPSGK